MKRIFIAWLACIVLLVVGPEIAELGVAGIVENEGNTCLTNGRYLFQEDLDQLSDELERKYGSTCEAIIKGLEAHFGELLPDELRNFLLEELARIQPSFGIDEQGKKRIGKVPRSLQCHIRNDSEEPIPYDNELVLETIARCHSPKGKTEIPFSIYWWAQVYPDCQNEPTLDYDELDLLYYVEGNNPLLWVDAYYDENEVTYDLWFNDEDLPFSHYFTLDRFAFLYPLLHIKPLWIDNPDASLFDKTYDVVRFVKYKRIADREKITVTKGWMYDAWIKFYGIWSSEYAYGGKAWFGVHEFKSREYNNKNVVVYVSNTWNHAMDTEDTNPGMDKILWLTDWNDEESGESGKDKGFKNSVIAQAAVAAASLNLPPGNAKPDDFWGICYSTIDESEYLVYDDAMTNYGISILDRGFSFGSQKMLLDYKYSYYPLHPFFSPSLAVENYPILILPSGSLFGLENSSLTRARLETFVKNGGTIIVFSQQHGDDYYILPRGDEMRSYGWREDISCNFKSAAIAYYDHLFSGQEDSVLDLNIDGFFTQIPEDATVLLARIRDGTPCLFSYPYGKGKVIVSSLYMDYAYLQGAGTRDEQILLRDIVEWSVHGSPQAYLPNQSIALPVEITNNSSKSTSRLIFSVKSPEKEEVLTIEEEMSIDPGQKIRLTLNLNPLSSLGYYVVKCTLLDENSEIVDINENVGVFVISSLIGNENGYSYTPEWGFAVTSEKEYYEYSLPVTFTFHIWNRSDQDRNILCKFKFPHHYGLSNIINPFTQQIFAPHQQETTFTYTLTSMREVQDALWADFYDENGNHIGAAVRGFYGFDPRFDIQLETDREGYGRGDTVTISAAITNLEYPSSKTLRLVVKNKSDELFSSERILSLERHETQIEIFTFLVPNNVDYGTLQIVAEVSDSLRSYKTAYKSFPVLRSTLSVEIDTSSIGQNQVAANITNTGEFMINDGFLTFSVSRDGIEFLKETREFTLDPAETNSLIFNVPFEEGKLSLYTIKAQETNYNVEKEVEFDARPGISISLLSGSFKVSQDLKGSVSLENATPFFRDLSLEIWVNELGFYSYHHVPLGPYERQVVSFSFPIPSDATWGHYTLESKIASEDTSIFQFSSFNIAPPSLSATLSGTAFSSGGGISILVRNSGGCPSEFEFEVSLVDAGGSVVWYEEGSNNIWVDEDIPLDFLIPENLVDGYYLLTFKGRDLRLDKPFYVVEIVKITGRKAFLSVATTKNIYFTDEDINCLASINNEDGSLDANLLLEIVQFTENVQRDDWWKFRHDLGNTGASSLSSSMGYGDFSWTLSLLESVTSSPAVRDINNDGIPDVIVISDEGIVYVIDGVQGLPLWSYETLTYPYYPSSPAAEDIDGDGSAEILISAENKLLVLTCTGQPKWEFAFNPDPYDPLRFSYIYSSPVVADLDNNGSKEVIAAFEDGLFVLDGETGSEIWHIEDCFTSSTPAVADLGSNGFLEIIVGQEYGLFVYTSTGAVMWDYPLSFVESSPVVADIDGDGELEVIARDWSGDLYVLSENGALLWVDSCPPVYESESPAVGDLDGDGQSEIVIPIGQYGMRVIETDDTFMWEFYIDPYSEIEYFVSSPALADLNGDGNLDVVVQSDKYLYLFDGSNGNIIWREHYIHGYSSPAIADVDGDGEAEIIACEESGMVYCIDSESPLKKASLRSNGEKVLWSTTVPVSLGESQNIDLEYLATIQSEGLFLLRGTLTAANGQEMATDECYFYVYPGELAITIATDKEIYWPNEQVIIQGELINNSVNVREGDLIISEGGQEIFSVPFSLLPGESMPYVTSFVCDSETTVCVTAASTSVQKPLHVESPQVLCEITAPDTVDHNLFKAFLKIMSPGKRTVSLDVSFYGYESLVLPPGETIILERPIQISEDTVLSAVISGDVSQTVQKEVIMGEKVTVTMSPEGSYLAGDVEIPFTLSNVGVLDSAMSVEFQIDATTIEKEYVVNVGGSIQDVFSLTITEGDHHLTVRTPFEELHFDIEGIVIKEDQATLQASIPETAGETLSFAATVTNTGDNTFTGRIDAYTPFWAESIEIQVENEQEFSFDLPTEPGVFMIKMKLICNGEIIAEIEQQVEAVHPLPSLHVLQAPSGSYTAGENAVMTFTLENTGGAGACEFFFDIPGIYNRTMRFSVDKREAKDVTFDVLIPEDIPTGDYTGIYTINGTEHKFDFYVDGVSISVSASLDRTAYKRGDTAVLSISVAPSDSYDLKVNYGDYFIEEEFQNEISITIPVSETRDVFYGVYDAVTKRSLYISSILLQTEADLSLFNEITQLGGQLSIYTDKLIYAAGEEVTVTVETNAPGTLVVNTYGIEVYEVTDTLQFSFTMPEDIVSKTYEIHYFFIGEKALISSFFPVKVEGYSVKVYQCKLGKEVYNPIDTVHSELIFNSNVSVQGVFEAEIVDPIGNVLATYEMPISLEEGDNDLSLDLDFSTEYAGSHKLRYSIYSGDLTLVSAKEYFDVGGPAILNMTTDKDVYEQGEPVKVHLDVYGNGAALLILRLDGDIVETRSLSLSGFEVQDFQLIIQEGLHIIDAELSANLKSTAYTIVSIIGGEPTPVEPEQPEIDMRPLAQYHIEQAEQLKEKAESLLGQARDKGIDISSIEELYKKANEYLETAKAFLMTVPVVANNWALQAIEAYEEVIELLENLLAENG
jgi:hypothetical protein